MRSMIFLNYMTKFIRKYSLFILVFLLILFGVWIGLFYDNSVSYENPNPITKSESEILIERVGKLVFLPTGETPTIATVSDLEMLKDQPFFAEAKKGDKVLIYTNAKKAILYDPVANKIVNMATLNIGDKPLQKLPSFQNNQIKIPNSVNENQF